jgi:XTP/dITP diphosphohydrolase
MSKLAYSTLCFVSNNKHKHREYCGLIGISDLKLWKLTVTEPQSMNLEMVIEEKIKYVRDSLPRGIPFFVEHTGLFIDGWNGLPGGLTALFMEKVGNDGICRMLQGYVGIDRTARAVVEIGYCHTDGTVNVFRGEVVGTIAQQPRGDNNFGWDPIFVPRGDDRTYAEMTQTEKDKTSMRRDAVRGFSQFLDERFELVVS